jgi:hypothetical protein
MLNKANGTAMLSGEKPPNCVEKGGLGVVTK